MGRGSALRQRADCPMVRRLRFEPLEAQRLLAIIVNTTIDEADGSVVDGDVSLRDAIATATAGNDTINFSVSEWPSKKGAFFLDWQRQLGGQPLLAAAGQVPEPATFALIAAACGALTLDRAVRSRPKVPRYKHLRAL